MSVCVMLKISVTTQMTRLCLSVNIPAGPTMVLCDFTAAMDNPYSIKDCPPPCEATSAK